MPKLDISARGGGVRIRLPAMMPKLKLRIQLEAIPWTQKAHRVENCNPYITALVHIILTNEVANGRVVHP